MSVSSLPLRVLGMLAGLSLSAVAGASQRIDCHVTYGGETRVHSARHVDSPYGVEAVAVGSYFLFKLVFQARPADIAGVRIYTYVDREQGPVPIHQASYPVPRPGARGEHGFTGLQRVYEPVRDSELEFWCEQRPEGQR
ncbi:hypothetical protein [Zoogloea sp.]|uniref:hypothetical protein n=1 Tax=Zoogloea sp. TaxID=49181 RepID=UPI0025FEAAF5|nr:hypothetical protein [Zoogloea sp.]MCK6395566.1 hypothetical protein [Zoogloea sp.]